MTKTPIAAIVTILLIRATTVPAGVEVTDSGFVQEPAGGASTVRVRYVDMTNGSVSFRLRLLGLAVGLDRPSKSNWYWNGFFNVLLDGKSMMVDDKTRPEPQVELSVRSGEDKGEAFFTWRSPKADFTMALSLLNRDDKLAGCLIVREKEPIKLIQMRLLNYPSSYNRNAPEAKDALARRLTTTMRTIDASAGKAEVVRLGEDEPWLLFMDQTYDAALRADAEGPSALLRDPAEWSETRVTVGDYAIITELTSSPGFREFHFLFWDFHRHPNAKALEYMRHLVVERKTSQ